jgi:hypothetical protein
MLNDVMLMVLLLVGYIMLMRVILPKLGVPT